VTSGFIVSTNQIQPVKATTGTFENPNIYDDNYFSVVHITDTQEYSSTQFNQVTQWIVDNKNTYNIAYAFHNGDMVFTWNSAAQWTSANNAMIKLFNAGIPYGFKSGNHDRYSAYTSSGPYYTSDSWIANSSSYPAFYEPNLHTQSWWGGAFADDRSNYQLFTIPGTSFKFLFMNLAYWNLTSIDWANTIIASHPDYRVMLNLHAWLWGDNNNPAYATEPGFCAFDWYKTPMENMLKSNSNIFMVTCGHMFDVCNMTKVRGTNGFLGTGNLYYIMRTADRPGYPTTLDDNWFSLYTFYPDLNKIHIEFYSPQLNKLNEYYDRNTGTYHTNYTIYYNYGGGDTIGGGFMDELWLDYDMSGTSPPVTSDGPVITSVNGGGNGVYIYNVTPMITWTLLNNSDGSPCSEYNLVIANDSLFIDIVQNISSINYATYPTRYSENSSGVTFWCATPLSRPKLYYVHVRGNVY
jgi:hypothetical protein